MGNEFVLFHFLDDLFRFQHVNFRGCTGKEAPKKMVVCKDFQVGWVESWASHQHHR